MDVRHMARVYAARGWRVLPLYGIDAEGHCACKWGNGCDRPGKHPRIVRWTDAATTDLATINGWFGSGSVSNLGVATGRASGFFALDIDPRNGGDEAIAELEREHGSLPQTIEHRTGGGGLHLLFAYPIDRVIGCSVGRVGAGIDVRGDGGQIVAPPSRNAEGVYTIAGETDELAIAPWWLLDRIARRSGALRPGGEGHKKRRRTTYPARISEGTRNTMLTSIGGRMRLVTAPPEAIKAALHAVNEQRCDPPLPPDEVASIVSSTVKYHSLPWHTNPREFFFDPRLRPLDQLLLRVLCDHANEHGTARLSIPTLRQKVGCGSAATVIKAIKALEGAGRITVHRSHRKTNAFRISRSYTKAAPTQQHLVVGVQEVQARQEAGRS